MFAGIPTRIADFMQKGINYLNPYGPLPEPRQVNDYDFEVEEFPELQTIPNLQVL
jgi:hypothetical protein